MSRVVALFSGGILLTAAVSASAQSAPNPRAQPAAAAAQVSTARGVIKSVTENRLVLDTDQQGPGRELLLVLDERTILQRAFGKPLTVKDLKVGDAVTVTHAMKDGKAVASRVWVRSTGAASGAASSRAAGSKGR